MSALAAMRAGAGYVTVGAPASLELSFTVRLLEAMMVGLPETDGALSLEAAGPALKAIGRADAVVLGPGLGKGDGARDVRAGDVRAHRRPARDRRRRPQRARGLLPGGPAAAARGRPCSPRTRASSAACWTWTPRRSAARGSKHAKAAASKARAFVVLKGDDTLVVSPERHARRSRAARRPGWRRPAPATCSRA